MATRGGSSDVSADGLLAAAGCKTPAGSVRQPNSETDNGGAGRRCIYFGRLFLRFGCRAFVPPTGALLRAVLLRAAVDGRCTANRTHHRRNPRNQHAPTPGPCGSYLHGPHGRFFEIETEPKLVAEPRVLR